MRVRMRVEGVVQGVGFRPFVHGLAGRFGLGGFVGNDAGGVVLEVEGPSAAVEGFRSALESEAPALAVIERVSVEAVASRGEDRFVIAASDGRGPRDVLVAPDAATCDDCLRELFDPADRRFRYPFLNCTNCGPRFTIVRDVPYDRALTTMAGFAMCTACAREYHDPADRRFHAQPVCCPACGPVLWLVDRAGSPVDGDPVVETARLLRDGQVVAVKGLGGYHLAADACSTAGVDTLRARKHREDKPFAVMVTGLDAAAELCELDEIEAGLLTGRARPIVLLRRLAGADLAPGVAPGNRSLGLLLPYTPLHHLLMAELRRPLVLTSGNVSDEPIAFHDHDILERLAPIADFVLTHDRPIHTRTDDSVVRAVRGRELPVRRSRGYVPRPLSLPWPFPRPMLACGGELKNTFCVAKGRHAFLSHHIGDLENYETLRSFTEGIAHFSRLFDIAPEVVAHDLHPEYLSTKYALDLAGVELVGVQHHHAHIAACLADNGDAGPVIGVAFDGLGYGTDDTIWGGEFLRADLTGFLRLGHLACVAMPGGTAAIREPWRMAAAYLGDTDLEVARRNADRWDAVLEVARAGVNSPLTSSAGRLFDAVAALLGVRDTVNYEGQAAIELEQLADPAERSSYQAAIEPGDVFQIQGGDLIRAAADDLRTGADRAAIAARFHRGVASAIVDGCATAREVTGLSTVALSGGVFQNLLLLDTAMDTLEARGFRVLTHHRVPTNDGGISLGQAAIAAARDRHS